MGIAPSPAVDEAARREVLLRDVPILEKKEKGIGKVVYSPVAKTAAETLALSSLRLLQSEWTGVQADIDEVVAALETLRSRGCRGKGAEF